MSINTICVVGLGYIGLPTAAVLASRGASVIGLDVRPETVSIVNRGEVHIVEPGLEKTVARAVAEGRLRASLTPEPADAFLIAVPTPFTDGRKPDLRFVESAARSIAPVLKRGDVVILESTSPVGATEAMAGWLSEERPDLAFPGKADDPDIAIAYCPERVLPGNILHELVHNDRVIGGLTPRCSEAAGAVYRLFVEGDCIVTNARTAELCKLTENSFRDLNIAFANELSMICDQQDIDVWELIALANRHPRVNILRPGPGVGGHCIAVDPWFIVDSAPREARLIRTAREVNDAKPGWVITKAAEAIGTVNASEPGKRATVACLGLAFKPDIDDLRESPALEICEQLAARDDCDVLAVEPHIASLPEALVGAAALVDPAAAIARADVVVILVGHSAFKPLAPALVGRAGVIDTCGMLA